MRKHIAAGGLVVVVLVLLAAGSPAAAQGMFSNAGDKDAGLAYDGDSFNEAYLRYYLNPRLGIQAGLGYTRGDVDDDTTGFNSLDLRVGALYEICGGERHRGYLMPSVSYTSMEIGPIEQSGFGFGLALGGDVKLTDYFMLGLEGGLRFQSFSTEFDGDEIADGTAWSVGNTNRLNLTLRFPHGD
jgi:hypothetical protein